MGVEITREHDCEVIRSPITMIKRSLFRESPDYYVEDLDFEEVDLVEVTARKAMRSTSPHLVQATESTGCGW